MSRKTKRGTKGWRSGNAVCCIHNGETVDKRSRGGLLVENDTVAWHCFNCNYKATYKPGWHLTFKFRKLLSWMGASDSDVQRLTIEAMRVRDLVGIPEQELDEVRKIEFKVKPLPEDVIKVDDSFDGDSPGLVYCTARKLDYDDYDFYVTNETRYKLNERLLIPCFWKKKLIGYTGRAWRDAILPKYLNQYDSDYVYNTDKQLRDNKFVLVMEGPIDAISIDGVATLGNEISEQQADIIDSLVKEVIVVPDADSGGGQLIDAALKYGWSVSFPVWHETCKDVNKAVCKYGKLFVLLSILKAKETNPLKIKLLSKRILDK
jgi:hypothetical protein